MVVFATIHTAATFANAHLTLPDSIVSTRLMRACRNHVVMVARACLAKEIAQHSNVFVRRGIRESFVKSPRKTNRL